jgi:hypothetical protein
MMSVLTKYMSALTIMSMGRMPKRVPLMWQALECRLQLGLFIRRIKPD